jgi:hypothetical protein
VLNPFLSANRAFTDRLTEVLCPNEDLVWIHDYHLLAIRTFLRKRFPRAKVGFFLHSSFPLSEIFRTIPVRDDLVRALLNVDLVSFHTFDYTRHFLTACSWLLGLDYQSKRGYIGIEYYGRTVTVKILPVRIDMGQLRSVVSAPETEDAVRRVTEAYKGRRLMDGVDNVDLFKGIRLKFLAMEQLLVEHRELHGRAVLVQIANPARSEGRDVQGVQDKARAISARVNAHFGTPGYTPIVLIDAPVTLQEKAAWLPSAASSAPSATGSTGSHLEIHRPLALHLRRAHHPDEPVHQPCPKFSVASARWISSMIFSSIMLVASLSSPSGVAASSPTTTGEPSSVRPWASVSVSATSLLCGLTSCSSGISASTCLIFSSMATSSSSSSAFSSAALHRPAPLDTLTPWS